MPTKYAESEIIAPLATNDPEELIADMEEFLTAIECLQDDIAPMSETEIVELQQDADYLRNRIEASKLAYEEMQRERAAQARVRMQYTLEMERCLTIQIQMEIGEAMQARRHQFQD